jgi:hypothetical protein
MKNSCLAYSTEFAMSDKGKVGNIGPQYAEKPADRPEKAYIGGVLITPTTPLRLKVAAALAFPDQSMSEKALRELGRAGKLTVEKIRGKDYTTLADIEEMRKLCRVQAKAQDYARKSVTEKPYGSSAMGSGTLAQAALSAKVRKARQASPRPKKSLPNTSEKSTTPKQAAGEVIPLKPL